jgi:phosphatidate cytidylyltransferase
VKARILTALILIPLTLAAMFATGTWPLFALALLATIIASWELGDLLGGTPTRMPLLGVAAVALCGLHLGGAIGGETEQFVLANAGLALAGVLSVVALCYGVRTRLIVEASSLWIGAPMLFLVATHHAANASTESAWHWRTVLLLVIVPVWAGDTAGMLAGRAWGKRLLAPKVSPKKTVVGSVANAVASVAAAAAHGGWGGTDTRGWATFSKAT